MSLYYSLEASSELEDPLYPLASRILPNSSLVAKMDIRNMIEEIFSTAVGEYKNDGYSLVSMLLQCDISFEESRFASIFERLPSLLESVADEGEAQAFNKMIGMVYERSLSETIERVEKHMNKLVITAARIIQNRGSSPAYDASVGLLCTLLTSRSRSLLQQQAATIRKAW